MSHNLSLSACSTNVSHTSRALAFVQRFALIAFALYHLPLFPGFYRELGANPNIYIPFTLRWEVVSGRPGMWIAQHVFHVETPEAPGIYTDYSGEYARLLLIVIVALVIASVSEPVNENETIRLKVY